MRRSIDRMLVVANRRFAELKHTEPVEPERKRAKVDAPAAAELTAASAKSGKAPVSASAPTPDLPSDPLQRAFAATFN